MHPTGVNRWLLAPLVTVVPALGIAAVELGNAMLRLGVDHGWNGRRTLENGALKGIAKRGIGI